MNLRTLKKLSKRAVPLLRALELAPVVRRESCLYRGAPLERKHAERSWSPVCGTWGDGVRVKARGAGYWVFSSWGSEAWPCTPLVTTGNDEWTAWEALVAMVRAHYLGTALQDGQAGRSPETPSAILAYARRLAGA